MPKEPRRKSYHRSDGQISKQNPRDSGYTSDPVDDSDLDDLATVGSGEYARLVDSDGYERSVDGDERSVDDDGYWEENQEGPYGIDDIDDSLSNDGYESLSDDGYDSENERNSNDATTPQESRKQYTDTQQKQRVSKAIKGAQSNSPNLLRRDIRTLYVTKPLKKTFDNVLRKITKLETARKELKNGIQEFNRTMREIESIQTGGVTELTLDKRISRLASDLKLEQSKRKQESKSKIDEPKINVPIHQVSYKHDSKKNNLISLDFRCLNKSSHNVLNAAFVKRGKKIRQHLPLQKSGKHDFEGPDEFIEYAEAAYSEVNKQTTKALSMADSIESAMIARNKINEEIKSEDKEEKEEKDNAEKGKVANIIKTRRSLAALNKKLRNLEKIAQKIKENQKIILKSATAETLKKDKKKAEKNLHRMEKLCESWQFKLSPAPGKIRRVIEVAFTPAPVSGRLNKKEWHAIKEHREFGEARKSEGLGILNRAILLPYKHPQRSKYRFKNFTNELAVVITSVILSPAIMLLKGVGHILISPITANAQSNIRKTPYYVAFNREILKSLSYIIGGIDLLLHALLRLITIPLKLFTEIFSRIFGAMEARLYKQELKQNEFATRSTSLEQYRTIWERRFNHNLSEHPRALINTDRENCNPTERWEDHEEMQVYCSNLLRFPAITKDDNSIIRIAKRILRMPLTIVLFALSPLMPIIGLIVAPFVGLLRRFAPKKMDHTRTKTQRFVQNFKNALACSIALSIHSANQITDIPHILVGWMHEGTDALANSAIPDIDKVTDKAEAEEKQQEAQDRLEDRIKLHNEYAADDRIKRGFASKAENSTLEYQREDSTKLAQAIKMLTSSGKNTLANQEPVSLASNDVKQLLKHHVLWYDGGRESFCIANKEVAEEMLGTEQYKMLFQNQNQNLASQKLTVIGTESEVLINESHPHIIFDHHTFAKLDAVCVRPNEIDRQNLKFAKNYAHKESDGTYVTYVTIRPQDKTHYTGDAPPRSCIVL